MALWGFAIAIALISIWQRPALPGQLPSYATVINLDSHAPLRFVLGLIILPLLLPFALRPLVRRLAAPDTERWIVNAAGWSSVTALWLAVIDQDLAWVAGSTGVVLMACLSLRKHKATFTRGDVILLPAALATFLGLIDAIGSLPLEKAMVLAMILVAGVRIAITFIPSTLAPACAFLLAPLAFVLQTGIFARDQRYFGWHVLALTLLSPFLGRAFLRKERRAMVALALVIYPIGCYAYLNAISITTAEGKPRVDFFEDGHHLVPASEILRGEKLYRDIVPTHGFIEDAGLTWTALRLRGTTAGAALRARVAFGALTSIGVYALAAAVTGSAEAGVLAFFLATMLGAITPTVRAVPALATLAVLAWSARRRNARAFVVAGAGTILALMTSLDFGGFTLLTTGAAILRFRPQRAKALRNAVIGALIPGVPFALALTLDGILGDFFRVTLRELPTGTTTGTLNLFTPPEGFRTFGQVPELLASIFLKPSYLFVVWVLAAIVAGALLTRPASRRVEPLFLTAVWVVVAALSYAMRHHVFFAFAIAPFLIGLAWLAIRRWPAMTPAAVIILLMMAQPTIHLAIVSGLRRARGPMDPGLTEIREIPRAGGALFSNDDAVVVRSAQRYVSERLSAYDTFFDFTDRPILYFLLRRDCPIRQLVVPFYETEELQRQVIATIERNPHVTAALVPAGMTGARFDGAGSEARAPLVWQYVQTHFEPDFSEGSVVFWKRRQP